MWRWPFIFSLISSCSIGVLRSGGERKYSYDHLKHYNREELKELSTHVVTALRREPPLGKLDQLFSKEQAPISRVGILVFETQIRPTVSGLSAQDKIYLSEQGKQLLTENFLSIWDQSSSIIAYPVSYISSDTIKQSQSLHQYGSVVADKIKSERYSIAPDDIFYLPPGKNTTTTTTMNPRGYRDLSFVLVAASELMEGPKFSEHMKYAVNDVAKELNLDALIIVMSEVYWTASHTEKNTNVIVDDKCHLKIKASTLIPFSRYHKRLNQLGENRNLPKTTIAFRSYLSEIEMPVRISVPEEEQNFVHIEKELLNPLLKAYKDQSQMVLIQMFEDMKSTH